MVAEPYLAHLHAQYIGHRPPLRVLWLPLVRPLLGNRKGKPLMCASLVSLVKCLYSAASASSVRLVPIDRLSVRGAGAGGPVAGLSEDTLKRLDGEGKLGLQRRRILGLPDEGTGED